MRDTLDAPAKHGFEFHHQPAAEAGPLVRSSYHAGDYHPAAAME